MNAPESRPDHHDFPMLTSDWLRGGEFPKLLVRWGAILLCALFWLGFLALIAYADKL